MLRPTLRARYGSVDISTPRLKDVSFGKLGETSGSGVPSHLGGLSQAWESIFRRLNSSQTHCCAVRTVVVFLDTTFEPRTKNNTKSLGSRPCVGCRPSLRPRLDSSRTQFSVQIP